MKIASLIARLLVGLVFVVFGLNGFFNFFHMPMPPSGTPIGDWSIIMYTTGWLKVISGFEVIGGLLVLIGAVPLGLCILCPIIVNILCFHLLMPGGMDKGAIFPGVGCAALAFALLIGYRNAFMGVFNFKAQPVIG